MSPVAVPVLASPSRPAAPARGDKAAEGGFRDMLEAGGRARRNESHPNPHQEKRTSIDRLPYPAETAEMRQALTHDHASPDLQEPRDPSKRTERQRKNGDEDEVDRADGLAMWFETRRTVPADIGKGGVPENDADALAGASQEADAGVAPGVAFGSKTDNAIDGMGESKAAPGQAASPEAVPSGRVESGKPDASGAVPPAPTGDLPVDGANGLASDRRAAADIAAILDGTRSASRSEEKSVAPDAAPPSTAAETPRTLGSDEAILKQVRLVPNGSARVSGAGPAAQQIPFGAAVAMLNLMTLGVSSNGTQPNTGDPLAAGDVEEARPAVVAGDSADVLLDGSPAEPSEVFPPEASGVTREESSGKRPTESNTMDSTSADESPAQQAAAPDKSPARAADMPVAVRLGTTAAGVVDTLVDAPLFKTVSTASLPNADTKGVAATTNTLRIQLRPVELGEITATISMRGDAITVELMTEKVEAYDRLNGDSDAIVKALRGLGLQVDQITIQAPAPTSRPEAGVQDQASNRAQQQFTASGHSAGSNSQGQRQPTSHGEQHNVGQARQSTSPANDDRAARGLVI